MDFTSLEKAEESTKIHKIADAIRRAATLGGGIRRVNLELYGITPRKDRDPLAHYRLGSLRRLMNPSDHSREMECTHPWEKKRQGK